MCTPLTTEFAGADRPHTEMPGEFSGPPLYSKMMPPEAKSW
jgi:hypothetical protein